MKKNKIIKYTMSLFVCFFALLVSAKASTYSMDLPLNQNFSIGTPTYSNMTCDTEAANRSFIDITNDGSGVSIVKYTTENTNGRIITVNCSWDDNSVGATRHGEAVYKFKLNNNPYATASSSILVNTVSITISTVAGYRDSSGNPTSANVLSYLGSAYTFNASDVTVESGRQYIEFRGGSCSSSSCIVQPSTEAESMGGHRSLTSTLKIKVTYNGEQYDITVKITLDLTGGTRIYPGNYTGVDCGLPSTTWEEVSGRTYYESSQANPTLPNCTVTSTEYEFKGWNRTHNSTAAGIDNAEIDRCYNTVDGGTAAITASSYTICLKSKPHVTIAFGRGHLVSSGDNWVSAGSDYAYKYSDSTEVALPSIDAEGFVGWRKGSYSGELIEAGTTVPVDGTRYFAEIQSTRVYGDMRKTVRVGKTMPITNSNMTSCRLADSSSTKVTVTYNDTAHECQVTGVEATEGTDTVQVLVEFGGSGGRTATYYFKVVDSSGGSVEDDESYLEINTYYNIIYGDNFYGDSSSGVTPSTCTSLMLGWGAKNKEEASFFGGAWNDGSTHYSNGNGGGGTVQSSFYTVNASACDPGNQYWAFCLDPGLHGPDDGTHEYIVQPNDLENSDNLKKLIAYLTENGAGDGHSIEDLFSGGSNQAIAEDTYRIAVHHATRFAAMMDDIDSGGGAFPGRYHWYINTAHAIKTCGTSGSTPSVSCVKNAIKNNFTSTDYPSSGTTRAKIIDLMTTYFVNSYNQDVGSGKIERIIENVDIGLDGDTMTNEVTLNILIPATATISSFEGFDYKGIHGEVLEGPTTDDVIDESGRKTYTYKVKLTKSASSTEKLPSTPEEKNKASFTLSLDGSSIQNMFLATSKEHGTSWQRMLIFNLGDAKVKIYIPFKPDCGAIIDASPRNEQAIVANQCCTYLSDAEIEASDYLSRNCAKKCTESTFAQVCSYSATPGMVDVYKVEEAKLHGENQIGLCVVNVTDEYSPTEVENFERFDQNSNKYNVEAYAGDKNKYCEVTCKEDWTIVMEAYGNYVGVNAIAAGTYFRIKTNDTFMSNKTECYTTYLDYVGYTEEQSDLSNQVVTNYNKYSHVSHTYTDIDEQSTSDNQMEIGGASGCVKRKECDDGYAAEGTQCVESNPPSNCGESGTETCSPLTYTPDCEEEGSYHTYKIKTFKQITGGGDDLEYEHSDSITNPNHISSADTTNHLIDDMGDMPTSYSGDYEITCDVSWADEPGSSATISCSESGRDSAPDSYSHGAEAASTWCNSTASLNSNFCVASDGDGKKDDAFTHLQENFKTLLEAQGATYRSNVSMATGEIYLNAEKFYACQHFELYNNSTLPSNATNNNIFKINYFVLGKTVEYTKIDTKFEPGASYVYDDDAYMTILGNENVVEQYLDRNNRVMSDSYVPGESEDAYTNTSNFRNEYTINSVNGPSGAESEEVYISKNYLESAFYWEENPWEAESTESKNYESGNKQEFKEGSSGTGGNGDTSNYDYKKAKITLCNITGSTSYQESYYACHKCADADSVVREVVAVQTDDIHWKAGTCFEVLLKYNDVNYVKTSILNGSFYKNKGNWYFSDSNGMYVAHGDNPQAAYNNLVSLAHDGAGDTAKIPSDMSNWKEAGLINVFPVSYSTPRNLYTYTYYFGSMGYYFDDGDLGRIMGGQTPIIENNERTCFYEVYEEVCRCCASDQYTYGIGADEVENLLNSMPGTGSSTYQFSDSSAIADNTKSYLGIVPSTVQLADFNSDQDRDLASNWGVNEFYYDGTNYTISKGEQVLKYIEAKGETIYSQEPRNEYNLEYSFTLTPATLVQIREYNDDNGYDVAYDRVSIYGRYLNGADEKSKLMSPIDLEEADTISFIHYGSLFLESYLPREAINRSLTSYGDNICEVEDNFFTEGSDPNSSTLATKMNVDRCRWVDFVTPAVYANERNTIPEDEFEDVVPVNYLRMAFK